MTIAVIGAGGVGGYFGGRLTQAGHRVTLVARGEQLRAIRERGLAVRSIAGDFHYRPAQATDRLTDLAAPDLVIVCVKAWQVKEVAMALRGQLAAHSLVLPLQNGVVAADELAGVLGRRHVIMGLCRIISLIERPGVIAHRAVEPTIVMGEMDNSPSDRILALRAALEAPGMACQVAHDIHAELWKKYIAICVSALLAVTHTTYGQVRAHPETRAMMHELMMEIYRVALAGGVRIAPDFVDRTMEFLDTLPYDSTTSLTRDVLEGRPSEIEYQNGTAVRLGEQLGVDTPLNRYIYHCILPRERRARGIA